jgi:Fur family transcriptional regulator, iron response regulator
MQITRDPEPVADDSIRSKLAAVGIRFTRQRIDLGRVIFGAGDRHFTAEMIHHETRAVPYAPTLGTIYNTLNEFARCGLLREIAIYDAKLWYDTKTGPHFHFYNEDSEELLDIPDMLLPAIDVPTPEGTRIDAVDIIVRLKKQSSLRVGNASRGHCHGAPAFGVLGGQVASRG